MHTELNDETLNLNLKHKIKKDIGEDIMLCYQCGKCTAGCPLNDEMDISPNQLLRMLQTEVPDLEKKVLKSLTIWLCLSCEICFSRCPKTVDLPKIMDYLRSESMRQNSVNKSASDIVAFHKSFLSTVKSFGRLYEIGLVAGYKARTFPFHLLQDVNVAPTMFLNGKLKIKPPLIKNHSGIAKIFDRIKELEEKEK
jgi:heterodisulfide reductase subunit C